MPTFNVYNIEGKTVGTVERPELFSTVVDEQLIHRYVTWVRTMLRDTLAHTKTRGEVSGGGRKPWKQKGTGRARVGSSRSPIWRKGGVVFGPRSIQNWETRMPRGERRKALFGVFSAKANGESIVILDEWTMETPKTKAVLEVLSKFPHTQGKKVLHIHPHFDKNIFASTNNIPTVSSKTVQNTNVLDLLNNDYVFMTKDSLSKLEEHFTTAL